MKIDIQDIISISKKAGEEILRIYETDFKIENKESKTFEEGHSPLTEADNAAHNIIIENLKEKYPQIPIISEESKETPYETRKEWEYFWLVDPLDGTKSFINKDGSFTVNIALIHKGTPILGVVYAPVKDLIYYTDENSSFMKIKDANPKKLPIIEKRSKFVVVASKNHMNKETQDYIEELKKDKDVELMSFGSSLKLCKVAEGKADIYPRLGPTMEWDTAAAHAVVNGAGKKVYRFNSKEELTYNKEDMLNPWFIVR